MVAPARSYGPSALLAFETENVRCFRDQTELTFIATPKADPEVVREVPWRSDGVPVKFVPVAGIFGANASGKTSLLEAIDDMRMYVLDSFRRKLEAGERWPFVLDKVSSTRPSRYAVDLVLDGVKTEYGFTLDARGIQEEWAYRYPVGRENLLFRRDGDNIEFGPTARTETKDAAKLMRRDSLLLSVAGASGHSILGPLYAWFQRNLQVATERNRRGRQALTIQMLEQPDSRERVLGLLRAADLGITDARVMRVEVDDKARERLERALRELSGEESRPSEEQAPIDLATLTATGLRLIHKGADEDVPIQFGFESVGTHVWLGLVGVVLNALDEGSVLVADELDASLHPALVGEIVRLFQDQRTNRRRAQLIFNSHDPTTLGDSSEDRLLGRDQVWFTEKLADGASRLYPLTDFSPRKNEAVERRYLDGRYGATPVFAHQEFERILQDNAAPSNNGER